MRNDGKVMRNKNAHIYVNMRVCLHTHTQSSKLYQLSQPPTKTADQKELQLCRDRHEDFKGVGAGERYTPILLCYGDVHAERVKE